MRRLVLRTAQWSAFLLLLALVAAAPFSSRGFLVYVAKVPEQCGDYTLFVLEVFQDRSMKLRNEAVNRGDLDRRLREAFKTRAEKVLFIKGDPSLALQDIVEIIDIASRQVDHIALITPFVEREILKRPSCGLTISVRSPQ